MSAPIRVLRPNAMLQRPSFPARPLRRGHGGGPGAHVALPVAPGLPQRAARLRDPPVPAAAGEPAERRPPGDRTAATGGHRPVPPPLRLVLRGHFLPEKPRTAEGHARGDVSRARLLGP